MTNTQCPRCAKIPELCVCSEIQTVPTRTHILILQHPQEPDKDLGSALLAHLCLPNSTLRVGLSWPNLKKALGRDVVPARWAVLYLGSGLKQAAAAGKILHLTTSKAQPLQGEAAKGKPTDLEGIVVLDGTWSQAKTLWWRNAWLLKLKRVILTPQEKSLYRELRREPRGECLSTIEAVAECLEALNEVPEASAQLKKIFGALLNRQRARVRQPRR